MSVCLRAILGLLLVSAAAATAAEPLPRVEMRTNLGVMEIELYPELAPKTVENFLGYVSSQFYNGTIFHRTLYEWIIQGGGYDKDLNYLPPGEAIENEADNGLLNERGTIAMARSSDPHSADSQFYINLDDNTTLNHKAKTSRGWGYCVFGRVTSGMEVADAIATIETHEVPDFGPSVPVETVIIEEIRLITN